MGHHGGRARALLRELQAKDQNNNAGRGKYAAPRDAEREHAPPPTIQAAGHLLRAHYKGVIVARQAEPSSSTAVVVKTIVHVVLTNGSIVGRFTVATLPAVVSNSLLGVITIPADAKSPIIVPSLPKSSGASPTHPASVSQTQQAPSQSPVPSGTPWPGETKIPIPQPLPVSLNSSVHKLSSNISQAPPSTSTSSVLPSSSSIPASSTLTSSSAKFTSSILSLLTHETSPSFSEFSSNLTTISSFLNSTTRSTTTSSSKLSSSTSSETSTEVNIGGDGRAPTDQAESLPTTPLNGPSRDAGEAGISKPQIIGAAVGSVSGVVLILLILLLAIHFRKRKSSQTRALSEAPQSSAPAVSGGNNDMSPRSSFLAANFFAPARALSRWRNSGQAIRQEEVAPAQRGFEKLGGRKLKSVLETGGDGYDNEFGASDKAYESGSLAKETAAGPSIPRIQQPEKEIGQSRVIPSPPLGRPVSQQSDTSEEILFRPSPARAITTESALSGTGLHPDARTSVMPHLSNPPPPRSPVRPRSGDALGRSYPHADSSRASRFTEELN
ncbi:hypothetical protein LOZ39_005818 [Ophidiomyces ophidiicola]|nr:hypothetical protein LOZ64_004867 [Ophidiomyces ophidiicola]KAI2000346.1 hypothetical protein LOZ50_005997 [Ophidiomyces ophidiicola]KAI2013740.1 hypothetical protein LOZ49_001810 [Ophidiomyces ophidiicola]KAI2014477.1 hypothetical protein LOZ46_005525 [Ophidiomyces ophidiicola]KAI2016313.1 hypothetical protein LOZ45_006678 [Ophidiomyces ophidiicola]